MNNSIRTNNLKIRKKKLLFLFPHPVEEHVREIEAGEIPSERLYGVVELRNRGWDVELCDSRFAGISGWILRHVKPYGINLIDLNTILAFKRNDIVVMKDYFSLMATLVAKILGKKIVYFDSMFQIPKRRWKRWLIKLNISLSDSLVAYSSSQIKLWSEEFNVPKEKFKKLRYTIDLNFYKPRKANSVDKPFVLAVGRDMGRDFTILAESLDGTGVGLKLVTLPYLVEGVTQKYPWVEIYERLSYDELFELYSQSLLVVIPLKPNINYPSGIRGVLESMALGKATICTRTPVLEECLNDGEDLIFVDAGDLDQLRKKILWLSKNESRRKIIAQNAERAVAEKFGMINFVEPLEGLLLSL